MSQAPPPPSSPHPDANADRPGLFDSHQGSMPFLEHLRELRSRLIISAIAFVIGCVAGFVSFDYWDEFFKKPLTISGQPLQTLELTEVFATQLKFSIVLGLLYASPIILFQILRFLMPAMTNKEKRFVGMSLFVGVILFFAGVVYAYDMIIPICVEFFSDLADKRGVEMTLKYKENFSFVLNLLLAFALIFQCPIIMFALMAVGLVTRKTLLKSWRALIIGSFLVSALVTPPDVISQVLLALPLLGLYFITLGVAWVFRVGNSND